MITGVTRRPSAKLWPVLGAGLLAALLSAGPGLAQEREIRVARLPAIEETAGWREPVPHTLSAGDLVRYRQIFALQREGRWKKADRLVASLDDPMLLGHVLAERYLHPTAYRSSYAELTAWLDRYADLPQARRIYLLASGRRPKGARRPAKPLEIKLRYADRAQRSAQGRAGPAELWRQGLKAWRANQPEEAAHRFARAAANGRAHEDRAGAAFWAARASLRARKPQQVIRFLRQAASGDNQFYALLAQQMLDESIDVAWQEQRLEAGTLELLLRYPSVQRAVALGQVGERELADAELQRVAARARPELAEALTALAVSLDLPSVQVRLAQELGRVDRRGRDVARYPLLPWQPAGGYRLEPTLVHAIIRAESGFDPTARSPKGAIGLMQVMPDTARLVAKRMKIAYRGERWLMHPPTNMKIGQAWLRRLAGTRTIDGSLIHLIAAYNAGEGRVIDWAKGPLRHAADDPLLYIESVPLTETRAYIKRVLANLWAYQARQGQEIGSLRALAQNRWPEVELGKEAVAVAMKPTRHARAN